MKIDLDWIQEELAAGREVELECVDRIGFLKDIDISEANEEILDQGALIVDYIDHNGGIVLVGEIDGIYLNVIVSEEFKYFRIKRNEPTFDDLIDVALTALKDRVLSGVELERDGVESLRYWSDKRSDCNVIFAQHSNYQDGIDFIKSLYTETFVIECGPDIKRVKVGASIELANGCKIEAEMITKIDELWIVDTTYAGRNFAASYLVLKGATVTQKRGK